MHLINELGYNKVHKSVVWSSLWGWQRMRCHATACWQPKYLSPFTTTDIWVNQFNNPAPIKRLFKEISTGLRQLLHSVNTENEQISCSKCWLLRTLTMLNTTRQKWKWKAKAWKNSRSQWMQYMPAWVMSWKMSPECNKHCWMKATISTNSVMVTNNWFQVLDFFELAIAVSKFCSI